MMRDAAGLCVSFSGTRPCKIIRNPLSMNLSRPTTPGFAAWRKGLPKMLRKKSAVFPTLLLSAALSLAPVQHGQAQNSGVSVNDNGAGPDASAMLDVSSSTSGMLVPRMTQAQRDLIPSPGNSLLIFQTDNQPGYYYNAGTGALPDWKRLITSGELPAGTVTQVTGTAPVSVVSGTTMPVISVSPATTTAAGTMSAADKIKLNELQNADGSETKVMAGANVWLNGVGTTANPYVINSSGGGGGGGFIHYIGELAQGGIIVYVWKDEASVEHGLVASLVNLAGTLGQYSQWSNVPGDAGAYSNYDGQFNTAAIISQPGHVASAALVCDNYTNDGFSDWYLPAPFELNLVYQAGFVVNNVLGGYTDKLTGDPGYWSSTEYLDDKALYLDFLVGPGSFPKTYYNMVRAVRRY